MTRNHFYLLLLAVVATGTAIEQNGGELQIPVENDNQFPPEAHSDFIEGSGAGVIEEPPNTVIESTQAPPIEHIDSRILQDTENTPIENAEDCPQPCVCRVEGNTNDFVVDCAGYGLTDFPIVSNEKATVLNIQNNKINEIPKDISILKNLKVLNANDNSIMNIASGSISELPELVTLNLGNNRLIEYPNDLRNSFGLTKLEELDLGGNDMRTELSAGMLSQFSLLRKITLPSTTNVLPQDLCAEYANLYQVCTDSCDDILYSCKEETSQDDLPIIPGMLVPTFDDENEESINDPMESNENDENAEEDYPNVTPYFSESDMEPTQGIIANKEISFRSAIIKEPSEKSPLNAMVDIPNEVSSTDATEESRAVTVEKKTGGVDKNIIGLVVAGMVVIVAVIALKKNWGSIKKRFGSNSNNRTPHVQSSGNANGTTPEEVPLQDKSPV